MLRMCGEINEEDGLHPREWNRSKRSDVVQQRKTKQLCRQVARTLEMVLGDCNDPIMQSIQLLDVTPNPDSSCMRIHVAVDSDVRPEEANVALYSQIARLQFEIARSINRKRVPNLVFSVSCLPEQHDDQ